MVSPTPKTQPNPDLLFDTLNAYQRTAALRAAIDLDVFTHIGEGFDTAPALAKRCQATERGIRILCDYLAIIGFLTKQDDRYALTLDSAFFLDRRSPGCAASMAGFLAHPEMVDGFKNLATAIRFGHAALSGQGNIEPENPIWVEFAHDMATIQIPLAERIARILQADAGEKWKVLDIAAGHGVFGIALAKHNPNAEIWAQDWLHVVEVAAENACAAGVASRYHALPGSAFEIDFGSGYDIVLITNFFHHFDPPTIENLMRKVRASLAPAGRVVTLDFIPNEDRLTPARAASFMMMMLGTTPAGDVYTFSEYDRMFRNAGFSSNELHGMPGGAQSAIVSRV
jgi:2-polyprenyl-3-methyl-5-hydroxy-6-metoxy-1,4-benzoquinol methylase